MYGDSVIGKMVSAKKVLHSVYDNKKKVKLVLKNGDFLSFYWTINVAFEKYKWITDSTIYENNIWSFMTSLFSKECNLCLSEITSLKKDLAV